MTLETIAQEIRALPFEERKQLVMLIIDSFTDKQPEKLHTIQEFRGVGSHLRDMDAQEYVNQLRREWDERP